MSRMDELPPSYEPVIRAHCENEKSELVLNALTVPQVGFIVCRGCGARLEMSGFTGARGLSERLAESWNRMAGGVTAAGADIRPTKLGDC